MLVHGLHLAPDGANDWVSWARQETDDELTRLLGGPVRVLALSPELDVWVRCDRSGLPVNPAATRLVRNAGHESARLPIVGPAVMTGGADDTGEILSLDPAWQPPGRGGRAAAAA